MSFPRRAKAVIFDMDGVLVDSMPYHYLAWYEALRPYGIRVSCFDVYAKEGERWEKSLSDFFRSIGRRSTKRLLLEIFNARQKLFKRYFKRHIFEGAEALVRSLKSKKIQLALVTGTPASDIEKMLPPRLYAMFDHIVAGNQVKRGKPHPEPYLTAAARLDVDPAECIVIENAPYGIESAKRAGMYCIAVETSLPKEYLRKADLVVRDLAAAARAIGE